MGKSVEEKRNELIAKYQERKWDRIKLEPLQIAWTSCSHTPVHLVRNVGAHVSLETATSAVDAVVQEIYHSYDAWFYVLQGRPQQWSSPIRAANKVRAAGFLTQCKMQGQLIPVECAWTTHMQALEELLLRRSDSNFEAAPPSAAPITPNATQTPAAPVTRGVAAPTPVGVHNLFLTNCLN